MIGRQVGLVYMVRKTMQQICFYFKNNDHPLLSEILILFWFWFFGSDIPFTCNSQLSDCKDCIFQEQPPRGLPRKSCSKNMQQIYRRTPMPKCDFNKVAKRRYWNRTSTWVFSCQLKHIFRTPFLKKTSGGLLLIFYGPYIF